MMAEKMLPLSVQNFTPLTLLALFKCIIILI